MFYKIWKKSIVYKVKDYYNFGGIRIEDDILITETGVEVLTQSCPKTVAEIESIMR